MSERLSPEDVLFFQCLSKADGLYQGKFEGLWGALIKAAAQAFEKHTNALQDEIGRFDRSLRAEHCKAGTASAAKSTFVPQAGAGCRNVRANNFSDSHLCGAERAVPTRPLW